MSISHVHEYGKESVWDFCHYTVTERICTTCGHLSEVGAVRNFDLNPLEIGFARQDCRACREMLEGREPHSWAAA